MHKKIYNEKKIVEDVFIPSWVYKEYSMFKQCIMFLIISKQIACFLITEKKCIIGIIRNSGLIKTN